MIDITWLITDINSYLYLDQCLVLFINISKRIHFIHHSNILLTFAFKKFIIINHFK